MNNNSLLSESRRSVTSSLCNAAANNWTTTATAMNKEGRINETMTSSIHNSIMMPACVAQSDGSLPPDVANMELVLRLLQLMCENHNEKLQNYLREQRCLATCSYDLVGATLNFLNSICGSTSSSGLPLIGRLLHTHKIRLYVRDNC